LRVASGNQLLVDTALVLDGCRHLSFELAASIHDNLCWPWVSSEPGELENVDNIIGALARDLGDLEPSGCGINHCQAMKSATRFFLLVGVGRLDLADWVRTDEVNTQSVPRNSICFLGRKLAFLGRRSLLAF